MEVLRYNRGNLVVMALMSGIAAVFFIVLFFNPERAADVRKARFLADGIGHLLFLPVIVATFAAVSWRATMLSLGNSCAIIANDTELLVSNFWSLKRVKLSELVSVQVVAINSGWFTQHQLVLKTIGGLFGKKVRVPLMLTQVNIERAPMLIEAIELLKRKAEAQGYAGGFNPDAALSSYLAQKNDGLAGPGGRIPPPEPQSHSASEAEFDADSAFERYMAKRNAGLVEGVAPVAPQAPAMPARPAFGRKGL